MGRNLGRGLGMGLGKHLGRGLERDLGRRLGRGLGKGLGKHLGVGLERIPPFFWKIRRKVEGWGEGERGRTHSPFFRNIRRRGMSPLTSPPTPLL